MKTDLTKLSISYLDSFGFKANGSIFWVKAGLGLNIINIFFKNILNINISRDSLDLDPDDNCLNIVDVTHQFRQPNLYDIKNYQYTIETTNDFPKLHLVTFYGGATIAIICGELEIEEI